LASPSEILVVDDPAASLTSLLGVLQTPGYRCTTALDFSDALARLRESLYDLLLVGVPIEGEKGLGFIRRARAERPGVGLVVISDSVDAAVADEIARLEAVLIRLPDDLMRLNEILVSGVPGGRRQRRWNRKRVAGGFGAKIGNASARVMDISYGGFRLEMSVPPDPTQSIDMNLLPFGFVVNAQLVWVNRTEPSGPWNCGAALSPLDPAIERAWRVVVDALPDPVQP
jgi:CheY-like chemotaxis protein